MNLTAIRTVCLLPNDQADWLSSFLEDQWHLIELLRYSGRTPVGVAERCDYLLGHKRRQPLPAKYPLSAAAREAEASRLAKPAASGGVVVDIAHFGSVFELCDDEIEWIPDFLDDGWVLFSKLKRTAHGGEFRESLVFQLGHECGKKMPPVTYQKFCDDISAAIAAAHATAASGRRQSPAVARSLRSARDRSRPGRKS